MGNKAALRGRENAIDKKKLIDFVDMLMDNSFNGKAEMTFRNGHIVHIVKVDSFTRGSMVDDWLLKEKVKMK